MTELEFMKVFGDNLNEIIEESGYSQNEISEMTGISQATISRYTHGLVFPSLKNVINLADALMCDIKELVDIGDRID